MEKEKAKLNTKTKLGVKVLKEKLRTRSEQRLKDYRSKVFNKNRKINEELILNLIVKEEWEQIIKSGGFEKLDVDDDIALQNDVKNSLFQEELASLQEFEDEMLNDQVKRLQFEEVHQQSCHLSNNQASTDINETQMDLE